MKDKRGYRAILFSQDGDWTYDYDAPTVDGVWEQVSNAGSRWFFYPFIVVVRPTGRDMQSANARVLDGCEADLGNIFVDTSVYVGRSIRTVSRELPKDIERQMQERMIVE